LMRKNAWIPEALDIYCDDGKSGMVQI
jgi:hypothetical protein